MNGMIVEDNVCIFKKEADVTKSLALISKRIEFSTTTLK
jgi:hypothetical protein